MEKASSVIINNMEKGGGVRYENIPAADKVTPRKTAAAQLDRRHRM